MARILITMNVSEGVPFYRPDKAEGIRASYKKELRNAYDNSIHYTDYVLGGNTLDMLGEDK